MLLGWIDQVGTGISGWCVDTDNPTQSVEIQIFVDGQYHGTTLANQPRPDLKSRGFEYDQIGFSIQAPPISNYRCPTVYGKVGDQIIITTDDARSYGFPIFLAHPFLPNASTSTFSLEHKPGVDAISGKFMERLAIIYLS